MRNYYIAADACGEKSRCKGTAIGANSKNVLLQIHEFVTERVEIERFMVWRAMPPRPFWPYSGTPTARGRPSF